MPDQPPTSPSDRAAALLAGLLDDAALLVPDPPPAAAAVAAHRALRDGGSGVLGPLSVRVSGLGDLLEALDAAPSSTPLDIVLVADTGLVEAAEARALLLDDDRLETVGLVVALPPDGPLGESAGLTLESLDFALPAVVEVPDAPGWADAVGVVADDGAERVGVRAGAHVGPVLAAATGHAAAVVVTGVAAGAVSDGAVPGVLNLLAAAAEATSDVSRVATLLTERDPAALLAIVASADPRSVRGRLASVGSADVAATLADLGALGLVEEDDTA